MLLNIFISSSHHDMSMDLQHSMQSFCLNTLLTVQYDHNELQHERIHGIYKIYQESKISD